jgi:ribulose 1,5-bisphosphate synthetase/thiazole synthase
MQCAKIAHTTQMENINILGNPMTNITKVYYIDENLEDLQSLKDILATRGAFCIDATGSDNKVFDILNNYNRRIK